MSKESNNNLRRTSPRNHDNPAGEEKRNVNKTKKNKLPPSDTSFPTRKKHYSVLTQSDPSSSIEAPGNNNNDNNDGNVLPQSSVEVPGNEKTDGGVLPQSNPPPSDDAVDVDLTNSSAILDTPAIIELLSWSKVHKNAVLTSVPNQYEIFNVGASETSTCKHHEQSKCYFKGSQMVVCHICPNAVHVLCCLNKLELKNKLLQLWTTTCC